MRHLAPITTALLLLGLASLGCDQQDEAGPARPLLVFGRTGMGPGEFSYPRAAVATPDGRFFVVDKAARIQCFTAAGEFVNAWQTPAKSAGKPTGLGFGPDGRLYVADTHYSRVLVYEGDGKLVEQFGTFGTAPGQFGLPTDVAFGPDGCMYVSEYGLTNRISKFSPQRDYLLSFGDEDAGPGRLRRPQSLWVAADGTVWVTDSGNHRVCHFDAQGRFLGAFGQPGRRAGELRFPYGLDVLSDGTFVVTEYGNNRLQRFDRTGRSLGTWGRPGRAYGELAYPWAAVVLPGDRIAVIDSGNNRVQIIDGRAADTWTTP